MSHVLNRWKFAISELNTQIENLPTIPYNPSLDIVLECSIDQCNALITTLQRLSSAGRRIAQIYPDEPPATDNGGTLH